MTATRQAPTRSAISPATVALLVLFAALGANLLFVWYMYFTSDVPEKNTLITVGRFFGLHVALAIMFQLVLISRIPWLDRRLGMDRLTTLHRWTGFTLYCTLLLHVTFIVLGFAQLDGNSVPVQILSLAGSFPVLLGMVAFLFITVIAISSARYARRRLSYETWHALHVLLYMVIVLTLIHQLFEITTFTASSLSRMYWWLLWTLVLGSLLTFRVVLPLIRNSRHQFRVAAVVPEADDVVSVHVTGKHLDRLPARAGQFMLWRFPGHNPWWQVNPWSLSAAPNGASLRLTAKGIGETSAGLRDLPVGTRVFAEGPYGALTSMARTRESSLLIAGGIGITPIRSLMEELDGPITVLYRVPTMAQAVLINELQDLARARGAQLHVLTGRTGEGSPPFNPFAPADLEAVIPDIRERDVYICGPEPMTVAVLKSLRALRVPRNQVHAERFRLAG
jgi:predicted ferric reductase